MTTSPKPTKDEALMQTVLEKLDALKDDAAAHIHPDNLDKCSRSECVVKVCSVRVTDAETGVKYLPLFSRQQVETAIREALAQPAADDKAGGEAIAKLRRTEFGSGNNRRSATHIDALVPLDVLNAFPDGTYLYTHPHPQSDYDRGWNDGYKHGAWASKPQAEETIEQMAERLASKGWQAVVCGACGSEMAVGYPKPQVAQPAELAALTPDQLADRCEAWLQAGGASNIVDAYEAGFRECGKLCGITAKDQS